MQCTILITLVILIFQSHVAYTRKMRFMAVFTKAECTDHKSPFVSKLACNLEKNENQQLALNFYLILSQNISRLFSTFSIALERDDGTKIPLASTRINFCEALTRLDQNYIVGYVLKEIGRSGNLPLECPLKANIKYYLKNVSLEKMYLPPWRPKFKWIATVNFTVADEKGIGFELRGKVVQMKA